MKDWEKSLNEFLTFRRRKILQGKGRVSSADMEELALKEYAKFNTRRLKLPDKTNPDDIADEINEITKISHRNKTNNS